MTIEATVSVASISRIVHDAEVDGITQLTLVLRDIDDGSLDAFARVGGKVEPYGCTHATVNVR